MSERTRRVPLIAGAWGVALFLVLAGTTASQAYWTTAPLTIAPSASGGTVEATQTGLSSLGSTWTSSARTSTATVTLTNTGTLDSDWSYALSSSSPAVAATTFTTWVRASGQTCTNAATPAGGTSATGSLPAALTGHLAPGANVRVCVRASISSAGQSTYGSQKLALSGSLVAAVGSWTGGNGATSSITIADDRAPTATTPTLDRISGYSTRLTWPASADNVAVTGYRVFRGPTLMATLDAATTRWTDASLASSSTYSYQIEAFDAVGNAARGPSASVTTLALASNANYDIYYTHGARCVDVWNWGNTAGTPLAIWDCTGSPNQLFALRPVGDGSYQLEPQNATDLVAGPPSTSMGAQLQLQGRPAPSAHWRIEPQNGAYRLVNDSSGMCMDIAGVGTEAGTAVTSWECYGHEAQTFQLRAH